jgi:hypothetical protein
MKHGNVSCGRGQGPIRTAKGPTPPASNASRPTKRCRRRRNRRRTCPAGGLWALLPVVGLVQRERGHIFSSGDDRNREPLMATLGGTLPARVPPMPKENHADPDRHRGRAHPPHRSRCRHDAAHSPQNVAQMADPLPSPDPCAQDAALRLMSGGDAVPRGNKNDDPSLLSNSDRYSEKLLEQPKQASSPPESKKHKDSPSTSPIAKPPPTAPRGAGKSPT